MSGLLKKQRFLGAAFAAALMVGVGPVMAQGVNDVSAFSSVQNMPPDVGHVRGGNVKESDFPEYADQHFVFAIDVSASVSDKEYLIMMNWTL